MFLYSNDIMGSYIVVVFKGQNAELVIVVDSWHPYPFRGVEVY